MVVLIACKSEEDPLKNKGARVVTTLFIDFSSAQGQLTPVNDKIFPEFKPIQAFMVDLVTCKNEEDPFKYESTREVTTFLPL